jgi:phthalate 4,5-dioxygenase
MLRAEDNEVLCRVGPGTPMGDLMRQYWIPALLSNELSEPDGPPRRIRLLGEDLIAFRDTTGKVGLIGNHCPHRGASLFFGRNEEEGIRCVYHGWKFDVTGACLDMPNEPPESNFKNKVRATAYPCLERSGVVWTYMGPRAEVPPLPEIEANMLPEGEYSANVTLRECSWLQALEGDIDTSHLGFLHMGAQKPEELEPGTFDYYIVKDRRPRYQVIDTEAGTSYGAYRPADGENTYWRIAHFLFPFWTMIPTGTLGVQIFARGWVPADDGHTWVWGMTSRRRQTERIPGSAASVMRDQQAVGSGAWQPPAAGQAAGITGNNFGTDYAPPSSDWLGRWRIRQNKENDYEIDRQAQRTNSFTGISGINTQDQAITESMGQIADRTREHLGTADAMIIRTRRRLLSAVKALQDARATPPGVDAPDLYRMRSGGMVLPKDADWLEATKNLQRAGSPTPR